MKKNLVAILALLPFVLFSCGPKVEPTPSPTPTPVEEEVVTVAQDTYQVPNTAGTVDVAVTTNVDLKVSVSSDASSWLSYSSTKATRTSTVVLSYKANETTSSRTGTVTISGTKKSVTVKVTQVATGSYVICEATEMKVNPKGPSFSVAVLTNDELNVTVTGGWAQYKSYVGGECVFDIEANKSDIERDAVVTFACKSDATKTATLKITQKPGNFDDTKIRVLAIGNSFSDDAMNYLYPILAQLGYTDITLKNLYVSKCSLEMHAENLVLEKAVYELHTFDKETGGYASEKDIAANDILDIDEYDIITVQQNSGNSGMPSSYNALETVMQYVSASCPFTPVYWHMTWAYSKNSTHDDFANYGNDQEEMYNAIVSTVKSRIGDEFAGIIPAGTAIQNLRGSFFTDYLTRDGYHLSYNIGRLAASLVWAKTITGKSIDSITWEPVKEDGTTPLYKYEPYYYPAIIEAVNNAVAEPFKVTATSKYAVHKSPAKNDALREIMTTAGYDLSKFVEVPSYTIYRDAYYNSNSQLTPTTGSATYSAINAAFNGVTGTTVNKFVCTNIFEIGQIPVGTVLVVKEGYGYRPDAWTGLNTQTGTRPGNVTEQICVVDDAWWGSFKYRAFNIFKSDNTEIGEDTGIESAFGIFVPVTGSGQGTQDYEVGDWNW